MGKIRVNTIGDESLEQEQKVKAEKRKTAKAENAEKPVVTEDAEKVQKAQKKQTPVESTSASKNVRSKKYQSVSIKVDKNKTYSLSEALDILPEIHLAKFDETVELHINTPSTGISGSVVLPHGTGKQVRVAILAPAKDQKAADELLKEIEAGIINFDVLIATPDAMPKLGRLARLLGPRGLMPNPKSGTVTTKPDEVAKKFAGGQVNFKTESKAMVMHLSVGKLSFTKEQLMENIKAAVAAIQSKNIKNITLKSTMSPGIKIQA